MLTVIKVRVLEKEEIYSNIDEEPFNSIFNVISRYPDEIKYKIQVLQEFKVCMVTNVIFLTVCVKFARVGLELGGGGGGGGPLY